MRADVPVTMGSAGSRTLELPLCTVTEARFPPRALLDMHTHNRAVFGVMLRGSFETRMGARRLPCMQSSSWVEPREEKHANAVGPAGAWVIVVQPNPERGEDYEPVADFLDSIFLDHVPAVIPHARRVAAEIARPDRLTPLSIESAALAMLIGAARSRLTRESARNGPPWLLRAREIIHETFREAPGLSDIARSVGVPPTQLAHSFRGCYGMTVGAYAREVRFTWTLERIVATDDALVAIAVRAGYADQSHMTRECRARTGFTPRELRLRAGRRPRP